MTTISQARIKTMEKQIDSLRTENARLAMKLSAAEKIFNHFGGLSELMKWENGQGETAANIVQEYLEL